MSAEARDETNVSAEQANGGSGRAEELAEVIREIRERVRTRHPDAHGDPPVALPDLLPLLHARDAAEGKVAAIGRVNPRPPGAVNSAIQWVKRMVARALDWHVRDQIDFNRAMLQCVQATLDALDENNRALSRVAGPGGTARELKDLREHWSTWREQWEAKTHTNEVYVLRTIAELNQAFQHRLTVTEESIRRAIVAGEESMRAQSGRMHEEYRRSLDEAAREIQGKVWADLEKIRADYERLIHTELRTLRQRLAASTAGGTGAVLGAVQAPAVHGPELDWLRFADRFRGSEERIRAMQSMYVEKFAGSREVLDIGCGRGEFLEAAGEAGIGARGIDLSTESVALCRGKGLEAEVADLFEYLPALADGSLGGVYCSQVVEHIAPERLPDMIRLIGAKLRAGGLAAFETPNPECLAIFASHFYIDPTHTRPVPSSLLAFYLEEAGFGQIEVRQLAPAVESWPELAELPAGVRERFFGGLDYALFARRL